MSSSGKGAWEHLKIEDGLDVFGCVTSVTIHLNLGTSQRDL